MGLPGAPPPLRPDESPFFFETGAEAGAGLASLARRRTSNPPPPPPPLDDASRPFYPLHSASPRPVARAERRPAAARASAQHERDGND